MRQTTLILLTAAASVLLVLGVGACGGGDGSDDSTSVAETPAEQAEVNAEIEDRNAEIEDRNAKVEEEYRERQRAEAPTPDEQEAKAEAEAFYEILAEDTAEDPNLTTIDSDAFCDLMSKAAREQTVEYAKRSSGIAKEWDCEAAVELLVVRSKRFGGFRDAKRAEVIGVNAEGDRATATIRFGDGAATSVPLVKEDGEWKLAASPAGGGTSG